jgi:hypothetical protein
MEELEVQQEMMDILNEILAILSKSLLQARKIN